MAPTIVNLVNFIRAVEPRPGRQIDLYEPVFRQIKLGHEWKLPTTFLLQYDALMEQRFQDLLKDELLPADEIGGWWEITEPHVKRAGIAWRGRYPWDWHCHVGFAVGYTPAERERLVDVYMQDFEKIFGRLPRSVGSWFIDAHTLGYMSDKYGIVASCNCKDQIGTDGYTLWGGYWGQAYYPSRKNGYMPAQTKAAQIPVPVFRMLGSDPIYQYESNLGGNGQGVVSLEPVYSGNGGGGDNWWVRWYFHTLTRQYSSGFAYAQAGQENSFGWPGMAAGLLDQYPYIASLAREGLVRVETLEASGRWFRESYPLTPATTVSALSDWKHEGRKTVWFGSRVYRANPYWEKGSFSLRDIHLFDENYAERYLSEVCATSACCYDTLPVMDAQQWSTAGLRAGVFPVEQVGGGWRDMACGEALVSDAAPSVPEISLPVNSGGILAVRCEESKLVFFRKSGSGKAVKPWALEFRWGKGGLDIELVEPKRLRLRHEGRQYEVRAEHGCFESASGVLRLVAEGGVADLVFA